jgi:rubrerythrin
MAEMDVKNAMNVLEEAKCLEQQGQVFYREAAKKVKNPKGKKIFRQLAKDEVAHEKLIQREILNLIKEGYWVELLETQGPACQLVPSIFPKGRAGLKKAVDADPNDVDAIVAGLDMENKSYDLYRIEAGKAKDPAARQMYEFLATQERGHFDLLMANYESMVALGGWSD